MGGCKWGIFRSGICLFFNLNKEEVNVVYNYKIEGANLFFIYFSLSKLRKQKLFEILMAVVSTRVQLHLHIEDSRFPTCSTSL